MVRGLIEFQMNVNADFVLVPEELAICLMRRVEVTWKSKGQDSDASS